METWLTADLHLDHANIIKYVKRPFSNVHEMNLEIILRWNKVISYDDNVYVLGDLTLAHSINRWKNFLWQLNGKIHLVRGNHDSKNVLKKLQNSPEITQKLLWVKDYHELIIQDQLIVLCHYAMRVWNKSHHGSLHCYGHSHGKLPEDKLRSMDVGVDTNNFYPYNYTEIKQKLLAKDISLNK